MWTSREISPGSEHNTERQALPFIYNNAACPSDPCLHMHTHADACTQFQGRFSRQAQEIDSKFKAARTKWMVWGFFLVKSLTSSHSNLIIYMDRCGIILLTPAWRYRYYIQVSFVRRRITLLTWVFPISNSFREPRKSVLQSTKICGHHESKLISFCVFSH